MAALRGARQLIAQRELEAGGFEASGEQLGGARFAIVLGEQRHHHAEGRGRGGVRVALAAALDERDGVQRGALERVEEDGGLGLGGLLEPGLVEQLSADGVGKMGTTVELDFRRLPDDASRAEQAPEEYF